MGAGGEPCGGVLGFLRWFERRVKDLKAGRIIVAWDGDGGSLRRRSLYGEYKAGRRPRLNRKHESESIDQEFANALAQRRSLMRILSTIGVVQLCVAGCEADDIVAFVVHFTVGDDVVVESSDQDLLQLLVVPGVRVHTPAGDRYLTPVDVLERFGCSVENLVLTRALLGDSSDNIRGIKGIGRKRVCDLFPMLSGTAVVGLKELRAVAACGASSLHRRLLDEFDVVIRNVRLMTAGESIMTPEMCREVRAQLEVEPVVDTFALNTAVVDAGLEPPFPNFAVVFKEALGRATQTS